jgi:hypothetical protein
MIVMHVRGVVVVVLDGFVGVKVAVGANHGRVMAMGVMLVVVAVHMFVRKFVVAMRVVMLFGDVQHHARNKESRGGDNPSRDRAIAECKSQRGSDKRR